MQPTCVALLAEGVDRNHTYMPDMIDLMASPSSRRAWIEIRRVARRYISSMSPSSRRAWIEIGMVGTPAAGQPVALLAEGVDRNM